MPDTPRRTSLLIVLDGFGYRAETDGNAIAAAHAPTWNELWRAAPHTLISGSGHDVGLPAGQMGNSEVGHMNLGAGRVVYQDLTRISLAIETGEFAHNAVLNWCNRRGQTRRRVARTGLLSPGGVHITKIIFSRCLTLRRPAASRTFIFMRFSTDATHRRKGGGFARTRRRALEKTRCRPHRIDRRPLLRDGSRSTLGPRRTATTCSCAAKHRFSAGCPSPGSQPRTRAAKATNSFNQRRSRRRHLPVRSRRRSSFS